MRIRQHWFAIVSIVLFFMLVAPGGFCQPRTSPVDRPKIGVALEGGGALGLAHIGVLKWFEEHRIPIDYLAGTSMGGLVGGMYSTGMSADHLRDLVSKINWNEALEGQSPYQALAFRRKEDKRTFQNNLEFGLRGGFSGPSGLSSGQRISYLFDREALPYSDLKSFDELPIPFRCVAADLTTGKQQVFESGPLGEAMRATMSLPAVFTPVLNDKSIWADGGLLNNLPVDVVKKMGADIVIAVYLNPTPFRSQGRQSMMSIMDRSISVMIEANELHSLETADMVVAVDLSGYTGTNYSASAKIIERGLEGAAKKEALLGKLSLDEAAWRVHMAARDSRRKRSVPDPAFVNVSGIGQRLSDDIEDALRSHAGKPLDLDRLERDIDVVSGFGRFNRFSYRVMEVDGRSGLEIRAEEKGHAPPLLNIGILVDGSDLSNVRAALGARLTFLDVGGYRSELRTDISMGSTWGVGSEYYHPFTPTSRWFVAPRAFATSTPFDLYYRSDQLAQYRFRRIGGAVDAGYAINRFSEFRVGYEAAYFSSALNIGFPVLPSPDGRTGIASIRYALDKLDSPTVPRKGHYVVVRAGWTDAGPAAGAGFPISEASLGIVRPVSAKGSAYLQGFGGTTFGHDDTGLPQFFVGGPGQLGAYGRNELITNQYWLGRLGYVHELFTMPPLMGHKGYITASYELGKVYKVPGASRLPNGGSLGLVIETLVGPVFLGGSVGDSGHRKLYFSLGRFF